MPCFVIRPELKNCRVSPKPVLGATERERIASFDLSWKYVKSMPKRSLNMLVSKPSSSPSTRSGLSSGLPNVYGVSTPCPFGPATGFRVCSAVLSAGCCPDAPYAPRSLRLLKAFGSHPCTQGSSLATYDTLAFGYHTHFTSLPNELLLSTRAAPVT